MLTVNALQLRKARGQQVGRHDEFPASFMDTGIVGPTSFVLPDREPDELCQERLTQDELDQAKPSYDATLSGVQRIRYGRSLLSTVLAKKKVIVEQRNKLKEKLHEDLTALRQRIYNAAPVKKVEVYDKLSREFVLPEREIRVRDHVHDTFKEVFLYGPERTFPIYRKGQLVGWRTIRTKRKRLKRTKAWKTIVLPEKSWFKDFKVPVDGSPFEVKDLDWFRTNYRAAALTYIDSYRLAKSRLQQQLDDINIAAAKVASDSNAMCFRQNEFSAGYNEFSKLNVPWFCSAENDSYSARFPEITGQAPIAWYTKEVMTKHGPYYAYVYVRVPNIGHVQYSAGGSLPSDYLSKIGVPFVGTGSQFGFETASDRDAAIQQQAQKGWLNVPVQGPQLQKGVTFQLSTRPKLIQSVSEADDNLAERFAWANVQNLHSSKDYVFNLLRSTLELKDSKETAGTAISFLGWLRSVQKGEFPESELQSAMARLDASIKQSRLGLYGGKPSKELLQRLNISSPYQWVSQVRQETYALLRKSRRSPLKLSDLSRRGVGVLAGVYLAWKFAIAPTIDDILTVSGHSKTWLLDARRLCSELLLTQKSTSTFHCRQKWCAEKRRLTDTAEFTEVDVPNGSLQKPYKISHEVSVLYGKPTIQIWSVKQDFDDPEIREALNSASSELLAEVEASLRGDYTVQNDGLWDIASAEWPPPLHEYGSLTVQVDGRDVGTFKLSDTSQTKSASDLRALDLAPTVATKVDTHVLSYLEGIIYANYRIEDVLQYVGSHSRGLFGPIQDFIDSASALVVAWELTPLSFIEDWFTNTSTLARGLQSLVPRFSVPKPEAEIWGSRKVCLFSGVDVPSGFRQMKHQAMVESWWSFERPPAVGFSASVDTAFYRYPRRVTFRVLYDEPTFPSKLKLYRAGARWAMRGVYEAEDGDIPVVAWKPQVNINGGKLVTLGAMLSGMISNVR